MELLWNVIVLIQFWAGFFAYALVQYLLKKGFPKWKYAHSRLTRDSDGRFGTEIDWLETNLQGPKNAKTILHNAGSMTLRAHEATRIFATLESKYGETEYRFDYAQSNTLTMSLTGYDGKPLPKGMYRIGVAARWRSGMSKSTTEYFKIV